MLDTRANYQSIGPLEAGLLKISLDEKASTASARTQILQVGNNVVAGVCPQSAAYIVGASRPQDPAIWNKQWLVRPDTALDTAWTTST